MKLKFLLFIGIILIIIGVLFRTIIQIDSLGLILIIIGIICKLIYIISKAKNGEYKPGKELVVLAIGLLLFYTGLYYEDNGQKLIKPAYLIALGITFKIVFIFRFIQIIRTGKKKQ